MKLGAGNDGPRADSLTLVVPKRRRATLHGLQIQSTWPRGLLVAFLAVNGVAKLVVGYTPGLAMSPSGYFLSAVIEVLLALGLLRRPILSASIVAILGIGAVGFSFLHDGDCGCLAGVSLHHRSVRVALASAVATLALVIVRRGMLSVSGSSAS